MQADWIDEIEEAAARRFPRWSPKTWRAVVEGPARELAEALDQTQRPIDRTRPVVKNYLKLGAEAIGLGYLYPVDATGRTNFFTVAWFQLLPRQLAALAPERQTEVLSACWNVGENLATGAGWFQSLFLELMSTGEVALETFEEDVRRLTASVQKPPPQAIDGDDVCLEWIFLGGKNERFLPGDIEFLTPRVAVVYHRHTGLDGHPKAAKLIWLGAQPRVLGGGEGSRPTDANVEGDANGDGAWWWTRLCDEDPRLTGIYASAHNRWRALCTLETSQFVVAAMPSASKGRR